MSDTNKTEVTNLFVVGRGVYYDKKGRNMYYYPPLKKAVYINSKDASMFQTYKYRWPLMIVTLFILLYCFAIRGVFSYLPFLIVAVVTIILELSFMSFIKSQQEVKKFNKDELISQFDIDPKGYTDKLKGNIMVGIGLAILLVYYAVKSKYNLVGYSFIAIPSILSLFYAYYAYKELKACPPVPEQKKEPKKKK